MSCQVFFYVETKQTTKTTQEAITDNKKTLENQGFEERETGFEPATLALARRYSTTEPLALICLSEVFPSRHL